MVSGGTRYSLYSSTYDGRGGGGLALDAGLVLAGAGVARHAHLGSGNRGADGTCGAIGLENTAIGGKCESVGRGGSG